MTQGVYQLFPNQDVDFTSDVDKLPPCNIEAEEAVIGCILLDPKAIFRVKDVLRPEHFYINAHKDIYQACLRLCKKDRSTELLNVTTWLSDHDILTRIGGRNKLASLVDRTVSSVNIDELASLVIEKAIRRQLIKALNESIHLAYETNVELPDVKSLIRDKVQSVVELPSPSKDDYQKWKHDRLLTEVTKIYTTCAKSSERLLKLKDLADEYKLSLKFLELFYLKSLVAQCTDLLTYDQLKELAGSTVREWLMNGLIPKSTTILLAADGGVGKTKLVYSLGKKLIQGENFGQFHATGEKRKIIYYQGDETPDDMMQALESLGYGVEDINKYVRVRFGWSAENMPALIQDLKEFNPDFVVIDSLSTANRFSIYQESQMEYARPILEMNGLGTQYKTQFLLIHHTNRLGGVRGSTAIRNAVSEVWTLHKDNSETATPYDRILQIDKSRSRSSGNKYRLMFSPDDLSFTFLGEEYEQGQGISPTEQSAKNRLLEFFASNRNIKFTIEELAERTQYTKGHLRNCLSALVADGLICKEPHPAPKPNLYFLKWDGGDRDAIDTPPPDHTPITPDCLRNTSENTIVEGLQLETSDGIKSQHDQSRSLHDHLPITYHDHLTNVDTAGDTAGGDRAKYSFDDEKNSENQESNHNFERSHDHLCPEVPPSNNLEVIGGCDRDAIDDHTPENSKDDQLESLKQQFPVGKWVRYEGQLAQVTGYFTSSLCCLNLDGQDRSLLFGSYDPEKCTLLTQFEMLELGLSVKLIGADLNKTPEFVQGFYYWSNSLRQRVKLIQIYEDTAANFKKPEALVKPEKEQPIRLALDDLRACHDSPTPDLKPNDVVACLTGHKHKEPITAVGAVFKLDSQFVWVRLLVNGNLSASPSKFYAHRVVRADDE